MISLITAIFILATAGILFTEQGKKVQRVAGRVALGLLGDYMNREGVRVAVPVQDPVTEAIDVAYKESTDLPGAGRMIR